MRELPKHHDRLPEVRAKIEEYRKAYEGTNYYDLREDLCAIEVLHLGDIPDEVTDALMASNMAETHVSILLDIATIIHNHPRIPDGHIVKALGLTKSSFANVTKPPAVSAFLINLRRSVIQSDVLAAGLVLRRLLTDPDAKVQFQAAKFILENNGQDFGYGKNKEDQSRAIKIIVEDKTTNSVRYDDSDLSDV